MNKDRWIGIIAAGSIAVATVVVSTGEAQAQKFRLRDLFQKNEATEGKAAQAAETAGQSVDEAEAAMEKADSTKSGEKTAEEARDAGNTSKVASEKSKTDKSKEQSTSDQLKSLAGKLNKEGGDPDELLQSARERFRAMKAKESASKKEPTAVVGSSAAGEKSQEEAEASAPQKADEETDAKDASPGKVVTAQPVAQPVTGGGAVSEARAVDTSRPPSLKSVAAVAAVPRAAESEADEAPPENLEVSLAASNVPPPKPLVPVKEKTKQSQESDAMEITSDEVEMDNAKRTTTFIGKVNLKHPTFHLKSDRLLIYMNEEGQSTKMDSEGEEEAPFKEAVATGARVIVERLNADGKKDVGQARKVVYDALTGDLVLSGGPPQLQSGGSLVKTYSESATITLKKNGNHNVSDRGGSGGGNKVIIPVGKDKKGKPSKEPNLIPSSLGDISNRK